MVVVLCSSCGRDMRISLGLRTFYRQKAHNPGPSVVTRRSWRLDNHICRRCLTPGRDNLPSEHVGRSARAPATLGGYAEMGPSGDDEPYSWEVD